jgi:hypothetical protein
MNEDDKKAYQELIVIYGSEDALKKAQNESFRKGVRWNDIVVNTHVFPEYEAKSNMVIETILGYLPEPYARIKQEPFIRTLLHQKLSGSLSYDEFYQQAEECIKQIRNVDLLPHSELTYDSRLYKNYHSHLPHLASKAKERLTNLLDYEPKVEHSLVVELGIRDAFLDDAFYLTEEPTALDYKGINIIKYREVLLEKGKSEADNSPLPAVDVQALYNLKKHGILLPE